MSDDKITSDGVGQQRLQSIGRAVQGDFAANQRVLSFGEYLDLVAGAPHQHLRNSAQYLCDMFEHYGVEQVRHPTGTVRRFKLFDAPWEEGRGRLVGQEPVQNQIFRILRNFARQGRVDRLILLHGPNGSSKSTINDIIARAMEHYSSLDDGALYRFSWVFPTQAIERAGIGFGGLPERGGVERAQSYAYLDEASIDTRLACDLNDHPLLLVPRAQRAEFLASLEPQRRRGDGEYALSDYLAHGDLCFKCKQIYEALLAACDGDFLRVMRHVQVERLYVSRRYRMATARVEPQMAVDAMLRQITGDRSLGALPSALQSMSLYEADGELVRANRGVVDFADLFKRPLEAFKYLLSTVESGQVPLGQTNLFFDMVFLASGNETHLNLFMESGEWTSFKGRIELVRVPYLVDYQTEGEIYQAQLREARPRKPVAPHSTEVAALWAVLTRLRRPDPKSYPENVRAMIAKLTPRDKALLYAHGHTPSGLSDDQSKILRAVSAAIWNETKAGVIYEGRTGASPREIKALLMNASEDAEHACLSPESVLKQIEALVQDTSIYDFLRQEVQGEGYYDHVKFIEIARQWYLDRVDDEVRAAMGLIEESSYAELFTRYVTHVTHHLRKEKLRNPVTGLFEDPDRRLMEEVERALEVDGGAEEFRQGMMTRIGAWSVDHPGEMPDYAAIFGEHFDRLRAQYFERQQRRVRKMLHQALQVLAGDAAALANEERERVEQMLERLEQQFGYAEICVRDVLIRLVRARYAD